MRINESARVFTADDEHVGRVDRIVVDPLTRAVTHVVVRKGIFFPEDKVIPIDQIATATEERINLVQEADARDFPPFFETHYTPLDELDEDDAAEESAGAAAAAAVATAPPLVWHGTYGGVAPLVPGVMRTVVERNIPERALALEPGARVLARGRREVGRLEEVVVTETGQATHIVVSREGLTPTRRALPMSWVDDIAENEIRLGVREGLVESVEAL